MSVFNPLFDLAARVLSFFYSLWPSYAGAIVILTVCVMTLLTPITIRSTKSMLSMRKLQPQVKRLQAEFRHDRQRLNEEMMALYRENRVNPLGGCLPLLMQSPVFIVLFQLLRGLSRRTSTLGWHASTSAASCSGGACAASASELVEAPKLNFNPDFLQPGSRLYEDLANSNEMRSWGLDLAETAGSAISSSFVAGLPYLGTIALVAVLGYYQQRQISGRFSNADQPPQARMMMKIIPIILPVISITLPAGLVVYYIAQSFIRIGQQALITRTLYKSEEASEDPSEDPEVKPVEDPKAAPAAQPTNWKEKMGLVRPPDPNRHGFERPVSGPAPKPKPKPPAAKAPPAQTSPLRTQPDARKASRKDPNKPGKRSLRRGKKNEPPPRPVSSRVTPKGAQQRRRKRRR